MQQFNSNAQNPDDDAERQAVERLTQVCEQFQIALQASQPARIEDFLELLPASLRAEALVRLLTIEDRHRSAQGKRLSDGEVLARFSDDADRDVVQKWLGQRSTQVFEETKVDPRANQGKRRPETQEKTYSADDFPNEDFDVFDTLGEGAQGTVYRVFDKGLRINRAVKILKANPGRGRTFVSDQRNREGKILARLRETGAGVLTVHRMGVTSDGERYLVMDYCKKGSLHDWIEDQWDDDHERPSLSWQDLAKLVAQLARTLALVHAEGLYHLDIKPGNILIGNDGVPLLADFAGSVEHLELFTGAGISFTEEYAAPEIHAARTGAELRVDGRTDLYSLGVVFYELLTGTLFTEDSARQRKRGDLSTPNPRPQPPRQLRPEIPAEIDRLCLDLLDSRFETRIRSATEVVDRLETILHRDANPPSPPSAIIKTVLLWGGWGLSVLLAFWMGRNYFAALWSIDANPRPRVVLSYPASPPSVVVIPGTDDDRSPALFVRTDSATLIGCDTAAGRQVQSIEFQIREPAMNGFGFYYNLVLNPSPEFVAEFDLVYLIAPSDPRNPDLPPCGPNTVQMLVRFEKYRIRQHPWRLEPDDNATIFDGVVCFNRDADTHMLTINFDKESRVKSVGVDGSWQIPPTVCEDCDVTVRARPPLQSNFGLLLRVGDLVLSPPRITVGASKNESQETQAVQDNQVPRGQ